jgi:FAD/FMN-containing dehydrogenase
MSLSPSTVLSVSRVGAKRAVKTKVVKNAKPQKISKAKIIKKDSKSKPKTVGKKIILKKTVKVPKDVKVSKSEITSTIIHTPENKNPVTIIKRNPLGHLLIEKMLREAGFRGGVSSDKHVLEKYSTDESIFHVRPQVVIQPKNRQDIQIATKVIARETKRFTSLSLTPRAAGTGLGGGSLTDSIAVDVCSHLHQIGEVRIRGEKITFSCEPGAMWRDVEKKLKRHDAYLPPYPSSKDICSIGGSIGNNAAGSDSLRYGHCADWVEELEVVLCDGNAYTIKPLNWKEYKSLAKEKTEHARIARETFALIEKNEKEILKNKPKTKKNSAGYALWHVFSDGVDNFKKGKGTFDLTRVITGSQGTIGIVTNITMRALPIPHDTTLLAVPIFDLQDAATIITKALTFNPINVEVFDALSFDLALKNPDFFKKTLTGLSYYRTMLNMYTTYHVRYGRKTPEFTVLITLDKETVDKTPKHEIVKAVNTNKTRARIVTSKIEAEMLWQIRRASYTLSKFQDPNKRPAAFLEDMTVPPENLSKFFVEIKKLLKEFNITAAVHGHGGDGHFHFYPLLDFTQKTTPFLVEKMAERFYNTAIKYKGNICGEHNDGIIRTPHLNKLFSKRMLEIFVEAEDIFDPDDIFNPGKKVNPRFDIKSTMRTTN